MKWLLTNYVFDASAKTVQSLSFANGDWKIEGILLITNVVDGIIIYNFADPAKGGTITPDAGGDILTLEYDTTSMSDTDELQIYYDDGVYPATDQGVQDAVTQLLSIDGKLTHGQATKVNSLPVTLASDEDALAVTLASAPLPTDAATETTLVAIRTAVQLIDNFISGTRGLVTEDNSADIKTAVEIIDNFISGSRGLVTEDNSGAIKTSVELIDDAIKTDDAAFTPAVDKVMVTGATFDDVSPDSVNEGDAGALRMSANRNLYVTIRDAAGNERGLNIDAAGAITVASHAVTNAGTFAVQESGTHIQVDDAAFSPAVSKISMIGAEVDDTGTDSVDEGDGGAVRMSANRNLYVRIRDNAGNERGLNIDANGEIQISGSRNAIPVTDNSGSLTVDAPVGTPVNVQIGNGTLSVGVIDETGASAVDALAVGGGTAHDAVDSGNPVKVGAKAANALPTAVANNDRTHNISDLWGRVLTTHIDPGMQVAITKTAFNATTTQTGAAMWTPASGKRIAITSLVIGTYGTTAARVIIWIGASGDTTYTAGTDHAVVIASFAPSATVKPGLVFTPAVPIFSATADHVLKITTDAGISIDVTWSGYEF